MTDAYIVDGLRTAIGSFGGSLSESRPDDLAALTIRRLLERHTSLDTARIADVVLGCANQAGEDNRNVARMALLLAGLPVSVPGETVNRLCASGMTAVASAARGVRNGDGDFYIAGGVESMTRAPYVMSKSAKPFARDVEIFDTSIGWRFVNPTMRDTYGIDSMGQTAENVADRFGVSRQDQDLFACRSQTKAATARASGRLAAEITPVDLAPAKKGAAPRSFSEDEFIRPDTTLDVLAKLRPAFRTDGKGSVTAGNSSGINDGAAALVVATEARAKSLGRAPMARILSYATTGIDPMIMGMGPVEAMRKATDRAGISLADLDAIELNEAFASQSLAVVRELGLDPLKINIHGGAVALGHPIGASGARILTTLIHVLQAKGGGRGAASLCVGGGMGTAMVVQV